MRWCAVGNTARAGQGYREIVRSGAAVAGRSHFRLAEGRVARKLPRMNRREFLVTTSAAVSLGFLARGALFGQTTPGAPATPKATATTPPIAATRFQELRRGVGYFAGRGGTIGWLANRDGLLMVDTQFPETATKFLDGLPGRDGRPLDVVINTHHHWDHTAGNATVRPVARQIVAHEAVPALQQAAAARSPNMGAPTLPDATFAATWRVELGDEVVQARHFGAAHTAGDSVVHFERANVVHVGDLVFNRLYPVTDKAGGCGVRSWIGVLEQVARAYPADTLFIFGHANPRFPVSGSSTDVLAMRDFLTALVEHVQAEIKAGKAKAEIVTLQNLPGFPDHHAQQNSRLPVNLGVVFDELTGV